MNKIKIDLLRFYYEYRGSNTLRLIKKTIGISIIASVFVGLFVFMAVASGFIVACKVFGGAILLTVMIALGSYLASS